MERRLPRFVPLSSLSSLSSYFWFFALSASLLASSWSATPFLLLFPLLVP